MVIGTEGAINRILAWGTQLPGIGLLALSALVAGSLAALGLGCVLPG